MKVAVPATGPNLSDPLDSRFGRARLFQLVDTESDRVTVHENVQNLNAAQGAGLQAGQTVAGLGADAVITANVGPKAFRLLKAAGVTIYLCESGTVEEALRRFKANSLKEASDANVEGHW